MKGCASILFLLGSVIWLLVNCVPRRRKTTTTKEFNRKAEAIAFDDLIRKYELEHQKLYNEETKDGGLLKWPDMDNKNLTEYCRKYLQYSVPTRSSDNATGTKTECELHYELENTFVTSKIIVVQCTVILYCERRRCHYITRASKPNCVYSVDKVADEKLRYKLFIINEHCDFEDKPLINTPLKQKWIGIINKIHQKTGQPIAKDEYLLQYELEHQEYLKTAARENELMVWPQVITRDSLNSYCYQYLRYIVPHKNREGIRGSWNTEMLHYQKLHTNENVDVIAVTCVTLNKSKEHYYITKALETNCVYAMIRKSRNGKGALVIIFKHCDFEVFDIQQANSHNTCILDECVISEFEVKDHIFDPVNTLQFFPFG